jgi:hypothetical protein
MTTQVTRLDYCPYLLVTQINDTLTHYADHSEQCSHDAVNRSLRGEKLTPRLREKRSGCPAACGGGE